MPDYDYTVDDCLEQIVKYVETMGVEDMSHFFLRDCLARLWNAAIDKCADIEGNGTQFHDIMIEGTSDRNA